MCINLPGPLGCVDVTILNDCVVIVDKHDPNNKIKISKEDWNDLVSQIRSGALDAIK